MNVSEEQILALVKKWPASQWTDRYIVYKRAAKKWDPTRGTPFEHYAISSFSRFKKDQLRKTYRQERISKAAVLKARERPRYSMPAELPEGLVIEGADVELVTMIGRGMTMTQISELLDLPLGTVKSRIYRARKQLREKLS